MCNIYNPHNSFIPTQNSYLKFVMHHVAGVIQKIKGLVKLSPIKEIHALNNKDINLVHCWILNKLFLYYQFESDIFHDFEIFTRKLWLKIFATFLRPVNYLYFLHNTNCLFIIYPIIVFMLNLPHIILAIAKDLFIIYGILV